MALILLQSPKGGVGTTFIAAQLALHLARRGHEVTAVDFTYQDSLKMFFGLMPAQPLVDLADRHGDALVVSGVTLVSGHRLSGDADFRRSLAEGDSVFDGDQITVADVSSEDRTLKALLMPHATIHVCVLLPRPAALAMLTKIDPDTPAISLPKTVFVLNQLDDRRRLSRDTHSFIRQLFGDQLIGTIRRDEAVNEALAMFEPIEKFASSSVVLPDLLALSDAVAARCGIEARWNDRVPAPQ